tara:strand:+ start:63 stop:1124 length:1062 start_codon:yes stop_codon:yes gene_type:complete
MSTASGCSFTLTSTDQYCEEYFYLPASGGYPPRLSARDELYNADPAQECANRCLHEFADLSVIVGGVAPGLRWFELADHMLPGRYLRPECSILEEHDSPETLFAVCTFKSAQETRTAIATRNGTELAGETIVVWGAVSETRVGIDAHVMDIYQGFYTAMVNSTDEVAGSTTEERCVCCTDIDEMVGPWENVSAKVYTVSDCAAPPPPPPPPPSTPPLPPPPYHAAGSSAAPSAVGAVVGVLVLLGAGMLACRRLRCRLGGSSDSQRSKGDRNRAASEALEAFSKSTDEEGTDAGDPPMWVTELNPAALQAQREAEAAQIAHAEDAEAKMAAASAKLRQAQAKAAESRLMDMAD